MSSDSPLSPQRDALSPSSAAGKPVTVSLMKPLMSPINNRTGHRNRKGRDQIDSISPPPSLLALKSVADLASNSSLLSATYSPESNAVSRSKSIGNVARSPKSSPKFKRASNSQKSLDFGLGNGDSITDRLMEQALIIVPTRRKTRSPSAKKAAPRKGAHMPHDPRRKYDKHGFHVGSRPMHKKIKHLLNEDSNSKRRPQMKSTKHVSDYIGPLLDESEISSSSSGDEELRPDYSAGNLMSSASDLDSTHALAHKRLGVRRRKVRLLQRQQVTKLREIEGRVANLITKYEQRERADDVHNSQLVQDPDYTPLSTEDTQSWSFQNEVDIAKYATTDLMNRLTERQMAAEEILFRTGDWMDSNHLEDVQTHLEPTLLDKTAYDRPPSPEEEPERQFFSADGMTRIGAHEIEYINQKLAEVTKHSVERSGAMGEVADRLGSLFDKTFTTTAKQVIAMKDGDPVGLALKKAKRELGATKKQLAHTSRALIQSRKDMTKTQNRIDELTKQLEEETDNSQKTIASLELRLSRARDVQERLRRTAVDMRREHAVQLEHLEHNLTEKEVHVELLQAKAKAARDDPGARLRKNKKSRTLSQTGPVWESATGSTTLSVIGEDSVDTVQTASDVAAGQMPAGSTGGNRRRSSSSHMQQQQQPQPQLKSEKHILAPGLVLYFPIDDNQPFTRQHYGDTYKKLVQYHALVKADKLKIESQARGTVRTITEQAEEEKAKMETEHEAEVDSLNSKIRTLKMTAQTSLNQLTNEHQHIYQQKESEITALRAENYKYIQKLSLIKDAPHIQRLLEVRVDKQETMKSIANLTKIERDLTARLELNPDDEEARSERDIMSTQLKKAYELSDRLQEQLEELTGITGDGLEIVSNLKSQVMRLRAENEALQADKELLEVRIHKKDKELYRLLNRVEEFSSGGSRGNLDLPEATPQLPKKKGRGKKKKGKGKKNLRRSTMVGDEPKRLRTVSSVSSIKSLARNSDASTTRKESHETTGSVAGDSEDDSDASDEEDEYTRQLTARKLGILEDQVRALKSANHALNSQVSVLTDVVQTTAESSELEADLDEDSLTPEQKKKKANLHSKILKKLDLHHDELQKARFEAADYEERYKVLKNNSMRSSEDANSLRRELSRMSEAKGQALSQVARLRSESIASAHASDAAVASLKHELEQEKEQTRLAKSRAETSQARLDRLISQGSREDLVTIEVGVNTEVSGEVDRQAQSAILHRHTTAAAIGIESGGGDNGDAGLHKSMSAPKIVEGAAAAAANVAAKHARAVQAGTTSAVLTRDSATSPTNFASEDKGDKAAVSTEADTSGQPQQVVSFDPAVVTHEVDTDPAPVEAIPSGEAQESTETHERGNQDNQQRSATAGASSDRDVRSQGKSRPSTSATGTSLGGLPEDEEWASEPIEVGSWETGEVISDDVKARSASVASKRSALRTAGSIASDAAMNSQLQDALTRAMQAEAKLIQVEETMLEENAQQQDHYETELTGLTGTIEALSEKLEQLETGLAKRTKELRNAEDRAEEAETELEILKAANFSFVPEIHKPGPDIASMSQLGGAGLGASLEPKAVAPVAISPAASKLNLASDDEGASDGEGGRGVGVVSPVTGDVSGLVVQGDGAQTSLGRTTPRAPSAAETVNTIRIGSTGVREVVTAAQGKGSPHPPASPSGTASPRTKSAKASGNLQIGVGNLRADPPTRQKTPTSGSVRERVVTVVKQEIPEDVLAQLESLKGDLATMRSMNKVAVTNLSKVKSERNSLRNELVTLSSQLEADGAQVAADRIRLRKKLEQTRLQMLYYRDQVREMQRDALAKAAEETLMAAKPAKVTEVDLSDRPVRPPPRPVKKHTIPAGVISTASRRITVADVQEAAVTESGTQFSRGQTPRTPGSRQQRRSAGGPSRLGRPSTGSAPQTETTATTTTTTSTATGQDTTLPPMSPNPRVVTTVQGTPPPVVKPVMADSSCQSETRGTLADVMHGTSPSMFQAQLALMKPSELQDKVRGLLETMLHMGAESEQQQFLISHLSHKISELEAQSSLLTSLIDNSGMTQGVTDNMDVTGDDDDLEDYAPFPVTSPPE